MATRARRPAPQPLQSPPHERVALVPEDVPLSDLADDPTNARRHPEANLRAIEASLQAHGQVVPLVARRTLTGLVLVGGHGTAAAMRRSGWTTASVIVLDVSEAEARQIAVRLNRTAELAEWDETALGDLLARIEHDSTDALATLGWDEGDLDALLTTAPLITSDVLNDRSTNRMRRNEGTKDVVTVGPWAGAVDRGLSTRACTALQLRYGDRSEEGAAWLCGVILSQLGEPTEEQLAAAAAGKLKRPEPDDEVPEEAGGD